MKSENNFGIDQGVSDYNHETNPSSPDGEDTVRPVNLESPEFREIQSLIVGFIVSNESEEDNYPAKEKYQEALKELSSSSGDYQREVIRALLDSDQYDKVSQNLDIFTNVDSTELALEFFNTLARIKGKDASTGRYFDSFSRLSNFDADSVLDFVLDRFGSGSILNEFSSLSLEFQEKYIDRLIESDSNNSRLSEHISLDLSPQDYLIKRELISKFESAGYLKALDLNITFDSDTRLASQIIEHLIEAGYSEEVKETFKSLIYSYKCSIEEDHPKQPTLSLNAKVWEYISTLQDQGLISNESDPNILDCLAFFNQEVKNKVAIESLRNKSAIHGDSIDSRIIDSLSGPVPDDVFNSLVFEHPNSFLQASKKLEITQTQIEEVKSKCGFDLVGVLIEFAQNLECKSIISEDTNSDIEAIYSHLDNDPEFLKKIIGDFGISHISRYPESLLRKMVEDFDSDKPFGLMVVAYSDWSGAFNSDHFREVQLDFLQSVNELGTSVIIIEASDSTDLGFKLVENYRRTKHKSSQKAQFLVLTGHGSSENITLGPLFKDNYQLTRELIGKLSPQWGDKLFESDSPTALISCSTAEGSKNIASTMAHRFKKVVTGPGEDTHADFIHLERNVSGELTFDVQYIDFGGNDKGSSLQGKTFHGQKS